MTAQEHTARTAGELQDAIDLLHGRLSLAKRSPNNRAFQMNGIPAVKVPLAQLELILAAAAAAPDMLAALKVFVEHEVDYMTRNNLGDPEKQDRVKLARAAIALAEGGGE